MKFRPVLSLLALAALVLVACGADEGNVFAIEPGECFDDPELVDGRVRDVPIVECDEPHDNEVYALVELPDGAFPGAEAIVEQADEACTAEFERYVGIDYASSIYFASYFSPSEESWEAGDRTIVCYAYSPDGPLEGSVRGAAE